MPYKDHEAFDAPNWKKTIWRYISIPQLISILDGSALYFNRADKFDDPFEGTLPKKNIEELDSELGDEMLPEEAEVVGFLTKEDVWWENPNIRTQISIYQKISYINCWHVKEHESVSMWEANSVSNSGVVIKSKAEALRNAFDAYGQHDIYIGKVNYIDFQHESIPETNILRTYNYKRQGFDHENELRAVLIKPPVDNYPHLDDVSHGDRVTLQWDSQPTGQFVKVLIERLIDEIRPHPNAPPWHKEILETLVNEFDYQISVRESSLSAVPSYMN